VPKIIEKYYILKNLRSDLMQIKIILSVLALFSLVFLVPTGAFAEITEATVTLEKSLEVDASPREATPRGLTFNDDGTKMYFVGGTQDKIYEYHLSTPFEIDSAVNSNSHKSTSGVDNKPRSMVFQDNGKRMLLAGVQTDKIWQYKLQSGGSWTPFDVSTANRDGTNGFDPSPEINDWGITWSTDGTKLFVTGSTGGTEKVFRYGFNTPFLIGTYDGNGSVEFDLEFDAMAREIEFNPDGTKMFVLDSGSVAGNIANIHEFELSTGFDIQTASKIISQTGTTSSFSVLNEEVRARGLAFNNDGTKMFIAGITGLANDANPDIHQYSLSCSWQLTGTCGAEEEVKKSDDCYDCEAPKLAKVEVHITSNTSDEIINENSPQISETRDYVWHFDQKTPYPMFDDYKTPIIADPGDEVEIIFELTDNRTLERIIDSGTYTNFLHKPNDMNTFYANNFDEYGKVSTTFYEWHQTGDDLFYDYAQTVEWSPANVTIEESGELDNRICCNLDDLAGTFTISFKMKFLQPMQTTDVWVQATDRSGNFFKVSLPLTLKVVGNEPLVFESKINQKVLGFYDESMLNYVVSDWTGSPQDVLELAVILGIPDEQLPPWVANLSLWVSEDKITMGDMIVSIEHLINN